MFIDFKEILQYKYTLFISSVFLVLPVYSWRKFFNCWLNLRKAYETSIIFQKRHNCVVIYRPGNGFLGWPLNNVEMKYDKQKLFENLYQPILYFIKTAKESLDIAVMIINLNVIYSELIEAKKRGVEIRIINNFQHIDNSRDMINKLVKTGVEYQFYITPSSTIDTIMHNKFVIKDYDKQNGYLCMGSMNFTSNSALNNNESLIFTSNHNVVEAFKKNFDECWENIKLDNEGIINKTILMDALL